MKKLYEQMASTLNARENCVRSGNTEWRDRHEQRLETMLRLLPHGSGFDSGTTLDDSSTSERLVFNTSFHHMNDGGYYNGWSEHSVIVTPSLQFGFSIRVTGKDRNDIKDYIAEMFQYILSSEYAEQAEALADAQAQD